MPDMLSHVLHNKRHRLMRLEISVLEPLTVNVVEGGALECDSNAKAKEPRSARAPFKNLSLPLGT